MAIYAPECEASRAVFDRIRASGAMNFQELHHRVGDTTQGVVYGMCTACSQHRQNITGSGRNRR